MKAPGRGCAAPGTVPVEAEEGDSSEARLRLRQPMTSAPSGSCLCTCIPELEEVLQQHLLVLLAPECRLPCSKRLV